MRSTSRKAVSLWHSFFLVFTLSLSACTGASPTRPFSETQGRVQVAALAASSQAAIAGGVVTMTQGAIVRSASLTAEGDVLTGAFTDLPVGDWTIEVLLYDPEGDVTHSAQGAVRVRPNATTHVELRVEPVDAVLELRVDLSGFPLASEVEKVRVTFHNDRTLSLSPDPDAPGHFVGTKELPAGDYDLSVELYASTYYASDRLYQSPWETVRLQTGKTTSLLWQAELGDARLTGDVVGAAPPPDSLWVEMRDDGLWLLWEPVTDGAVAAYRVYFKTDEFRPFEEEGETGAQSIGWKLPLDRWEEGQAVWASVTSVTEDGNESYRSPVIQVHPAE